MEIHIEPPKRTKRSAKVYEMADAEREELKALCGRRAKGEKRDWASIGKVLGNVLDRDQDQSEGTVIQLSNPEDIPPYALFIIVMADRMPRVMKGSPRRFNDIRTPAHTGPGYAHIREAVIEQLEEQGFSWSDKGFVNEDDELVRFRA